jgi:hypothetical protein
MQTEELVSRVRQAYEAFGRNGQVFAGVQRGWTQLAGSSGEPTCAHQIFPGEGRSGRLISDGPDRAERRVDGSG